MSVGEALGITLAETPNIVGQDRRELSEVFNFDAIRITRSNGFYQARDWKLPELKAIYDQHAQVLGTENWDTVFLSNHDNPRVVSTFGDDSPQNRAASAKLIETMLLTLRGTPYLYQGDELGMTNYPFKQVSDFDDIEVKNAYKAKVVTGQMTESDFFAQTSRFGRDNSRTPMQWDGSSQGGFTTASKSWLAVNPNYTTINAAQQMADPQSIYRYVQKAIALHHSSKAFTYGDYKDLDPANPEIYAYTRTLGADRFLVVLNYSKSPATYALPSGMQPGRLVLGNLTDTTADGATLNLRPWESRVYKF